MRPDEFAALIGRLRPVFEQYRVLKAIVFGSVARGETSRHSDLDLIVVMDTDKRFLDRYEGILRDITAAAQHYDVDLLIYTPPRAVTHGRATLVQNSDCRREGYL